jgi:hypothetical protein
VGTGNAPGSTEADVRYGIEVVPFGAYADPGPVVELAVAAEEAGWEALALWDHGHFPGGVGDPWVTFAAVAAVTKRLRLVTDVSPVPRYRPHLLARSVHAVDSLSGGRVTLGAGLGQAWDLDAVGDHHDDVTRAAMADEALELVVRWCNGETVEHAGEYYRADGVQVASGPTQRPRVPVWVGGTSRPALRRAARWDGWIVPTIGEDLSVTFGPERVADGLAYLREHGAGVGFDVAVNGGTGAGETGMTSDYADAGATWWLESLFERRASYEELLARVAAGPPS